MKDFLRALSLLTVLPVRVQWDESIPSGRAMAAYPLVGAVIGAILVALALLLDRIGLSRLTPFLPAAFIVAAWAALTGGLHLDGWVDCCDALFVPATRERRLDILHDPHVGSFGVTGLVLLLLVKFAALPPLFQQRGDFWPLIIAPVLGRWAIVIAAVCFPLARKEGMATRFCQGVGRRHITLATLTMLLLCGAAGVIGMTTLVSSALVTIAFGRFASNRLGGLTGDVYGAMVELVETSTLIVCALTSALL